MPPTNPPAPTNPAANPAPPHPATPPRDPHTDALPTAAAATLLALIVLISSGIDLLFYTGHFASDDRSYLQAAWRILNQANYSSDPGIAFMRLTLVAWNALVAALVGWNVALISGSYILFHQACVVLTYALGAQYFNRGIGLLAAWYVGSAGLLVAFSTTVLPDLPLTCFLLLALLCFGAAYRARAARQPRRTWWLMVVAGAGVGLAYGAKETALIALPFFFTWWLAAERLRPSRRGLWTGLAFLIGFAAVFLAEFAALSYLTGHAHLRMGWSVGADRFSGELHVFRDGYYPLERLEAVRRNLDYWFQNTRMEWVFVGAAVLYPFVRRRSWTLWLFALWFFAYRVFGSVKLDSYVPATLQARYFTMLVPLASLMLAVVMGQVHAWLPRRLGEARAKGLQAALVVGLVAYPIFGLQAADRLAGKHYRADAVLTGHTALRHALALGDRPVVLSGTVRLNLLVFLLEPQVDAIVDPRRIDGRRDDLLAHGFYYIEHYQPGKFRPSRVQGFDAALHPVVIPDAVAEEALEPRFGPIALDYGVLEIDGVAGRLTRVARFDVWRKRLPKVLHAMCGYSGMERDDAEWSSCVYRWEPGG